MDKNKKLFPQRLWDLIHDERYNHFLRWSEDGQRVYLNRNDFEEQYLKTPNNQFHTQKAISFVRQMNMYGFKKVDDSHYENDNFKKDCHHLIKNMVRRNSNRPQHMAYDASDIPVLNSGSHNNDQNDSNPSVNRVQSLPPNNTSPDSLIGGPSLMGPMTAAGSFLSNVGEHSANDMAVNLSGQNNLKALYQQLATLTQLPQGSSELGQSAMQQACTASLSKPNDSLVSMDPVMTGDMANIAQSSLASTLYQRIAALSNTNAVGVNNPLINHQQHLNQEAEDQSIRDLASQPIFTLTNNAQVEQNLSTNSNVIPDLTQQYGLMEGCQQQLNPIIDQSMGQTQSIAAQQILQQTLIRSLMQLKLAQLPQTFDQNFLRSLNNRDLNVLNNQTVSGNVPSTSNFESYDSGPLELVANSSSSSPSITVEPNPNSSLAENNRTYEVRALDNLRRRSDNFSQVGHMLQGGYIDDSGDNENEFTVDYDDDRSNSRDDIQANLSPSSANHEPSSLCQSRHNESIGTVMNLVRKNPGGN